MSKDTKFNILRGVVMASYLEHEEKIELLEFINELEEKEEADSE